MGHIWNIVKGLVPGMIRDQLQAHILPWGILWELLQGPLGVHWAQSGQSGFRGRHKPDDQLKAVYTLFGVDSQSSLYSVIFKVNLS